MQIRFSYETKYGIFSDALNLPDDHGFTEQELIAMQEQRRDNWIQYIDSTQVETPIETIPETPSDPTSEITSEIPSDTTSETPSEPLI